MTMATGAEGIGAGQRIDGMTWWWLWLIAVAFPAVLTAQVEPAHAPAVADEPLAGELSLARAAAAMDGSALAWQAENRCSQCHANMLHLIARPVLDPVTAARPEVRELYEWLVNERWEKEGLRYPAEAAVVAVPLAFNDARTTGRLHPLTERALTRMLSLQQPDGGWKWVIGAPKSFVREFDLTMFAALGVAVAPEKYAARPEAQRALEGVRNWVKKNRPRTVHAKGMLLWAAAMVPGLADEPARKAMAEALLALQGEDGGWAVENLAAKSKTFEAVEFDSRRASDGYGTGFAVFQARNGGIPATDPRIQRGVRWLQTHQRESGRWYTGSLNKRPNHVLSNSGTAYAVLALESCGLIP